ncbi:WcaF family extracellular polysaccharide biosynthesis acetyltransferase [Paenibacillus hunanensis]|uniref:WcaF family extracellular polysaccharide biosynthesis acetyltransferase n=1 Tax=Paenibacillus hunanensis TaxID=539262 RepID=UPI0020268F32|nr:WcaF family extracellular polysaccharide biosynthesis acetyltransferase [Paenibacillus hunanensis]MCL9660784.1 WcaF family extracellular polysaccharide biosynthesis acetyltransferase [Paenibacillus hunanensis]
MTQIRLDQYSQAEYSRGKPGWYCLIWWFVQGTLFRFSLHNMYGWRRFLLNLFGAKLAPGVRVRASAKFTYPWKVTIGEHSWIGDDVEFYSLDEIIIGSQCVISQNTYLCTGSHKLSDPTFGLITKPIVIKDGAWVASDVFVYPGITIHELGVAGARSTVVKDIPRNEVHIGFPAAFFKHRFPKEEPKPAVHIVK